MTKAQQQNIDLISIAKRFNYDSVDEARRHIEFAGRWMQKNPGQQQPAHIKRAVDALVAFQLYQHEQRLGIQQRIAKLNRSPRIFFGAIINGARGARARRFVRRVLGLYLSPDRMVEHFSAIIPPDSGRHYANLTSDAARYESLEQFAKAANIIYGIYEKPDKLPSPLFVAEKALEKIA